MCFFYPITSIIRAEPGGAQVHLLELLRGFRDRAELHLGVGEDRDGFLIEEVKALGVEAHLLRNLVHPIRPDMDLAALAEVMGLLRRAQPHLLHAYSSKAGFVGRVAAQVLGTQGFCTALSWIGGEGGSLLWRSSLRW